MLRPDLPLVGAFMATVFAISVTAQTTSPKTASSIAGAASTNDAKVKAEAATYIKSGNTKYEAGDLNGAMEDFTKATQLDPKNADGWGNRGVVLYKMKKHSEAVADLSKAITVATSVREFSDVLAALHYYRGSALYELDQLERAEADLKRSKEIDPEDQLGAGWRLTQVQLRSENKQKIAAATKAIAANVKDPDAYVRRAEAYGYLSQYDQAIADLTKAIELTSSKAELYRKRAYYYGFVNPKREDLALADYSKAIELKPNDKSSRTSRAIQYEMAGRNVEALADWSKLIELEPDNRAIYIRRGDVSRKLEKYDAAIADYTKSLSLKAEDYMAGMLAAQAYVGRGNSLAAQGKHDASLNDFDRAVSIAKTDEMARNMIIEATQGRAAALCKLGKKEAARKDEQLLLSAQVKVANPCN